MKTRHKDTGPPWPWASRHMLIGIMVLLLAIAVGWAANTPVRSIFPYAFAVGLVAWRHGLTTSFLFAALATLAALATGAFPSRVEFSGQELGEGLYTYLLLSAIAACVTLGKRISRP